MKVYVLMINPNPQVFDGAFEIKGVYWNREEAFKVGEAYCRSNRFIMEVYDDLKAENPDFSFNDICTCFDEFMFIEEQEVKGTKPKEEEEEDE